MTTFSFSSLLACALTAFLGTFALYRNPKAILNRVFFLYCLAGSFAAFAEFEYRLAESPDTALFWIRASFPWILSTPLELHFIARFTGRAWLIENRLTHVLLYTLTLLFCLLWVTGLISIQPEPAYWGWTYTRPQHNTFLNLLGVFVAATISYEIFSCSWYYVHQTKHKKKRQAGLILTGIVLTTILVLITEPGWLFNSFQIKIPRLTSLGFILEGVFLTYAVWKYELFSLTPATAAESIIATLTDALILVTPEGKITMANQATLDLLGYQENELLNQPIETILTSEETTNFEHAWLERLLVTGSIRDDEITFLTKDAKKIPASLSASLVRNEQGVEQGIVYVGRDLTERKRIEEQIKASLREKEILLKEIHHRVKNNLQVVSSLLMLQSGYARDKQTLETLKESQNRIHSMAFIHETLYGSDDLAQVDFTKYTQRLANHLLHSYDVNSCNVTLKVNVIQTPLSIDTAIPCGLIIHELVSNALKYAFPDGQAGKIHIGLHANRPHQLTLTVRDNGVGLPADIQVTQTKTLGLQLVTMLSKQLEGTIELDRSNGTTFKIAFSP
jgi:PAS domain S-box-containing protein